MLPTLITSLISGEAADALARARRAAVVYALAGLLVLAGVGFLLGAGYIVAARRFGSLEAALGFAGAFILLAIILVISLRIWTKTRARRVAERRKREVTGIATAAALALLPALITRKGVVSGLAVPLAAAIAYAIWRENAPRNPPGRG